MEIGDAGVRSGVAHIDFNLDYHAIWTPGQEYEGKMLPLIAGRQTGEFCSVSTLGVQGVK
jgi:hypothetical protein